MTVRIPRLVASVPLLVAGSASAVESAAPVVEGSSEGVTLRYSAARGCPTEAEFVSEVLARVRRPVSFGAPQAVINMAVTLAHQDQEATGELTVEQPGGEPTRREFTATSCSEVGSALALVAALSLDPNARTETLPAREPSTVPLPPPPDAEVVTAPSAPAEQQAPAPLPKTAPLAPPPRRSRWLAWLGPSAGVGLGQAPGPLGLVGVSLGARWKREQLLSPSLQVTPLWGKTGVTGANAERGDFAWTMGRLEACPASFRLTPRLRLDPCAALEVGRLTASGKGAAILVATTARRWWVAPGAALALHLNYQSWFIRFAALALAPATRDSFEFGEPNRPVHRANAVVVGAALTLGFQGGEDQTRDVRP